MSTFTPDPKPEARHVANRDEWNAIILAKMGVCRGCGQHGEEFHHLVSRAQRGDDVAGNIVPLCKLCHLAITDHLAGWEEIAQEVRHSLTPNERAYIVAKKSRAWLQRSYPAGAVALCARCRKPLAPEKPGELEKPRPRKTLTIRVPADAENGSAIFKELVAACGESLSAALGYDADTSVLRADRGHGHLLAAGDGFGRLAREAQERKAGMTS